MPIENDFGYRLESLMDKRGYSNNRLTKELGLSKNAIGNYKNNQIPNATILYNISQILGTSMEYLLTGKDGDTLTPEEQQLLNAYRRAGRTEKEAILTNAKILAPNQDESSSCRTG